MTLLNEITLPRPGDDDLAGVLQPANDGNDSRLGRFVCLLLGMNLLNGALLALIYRHMQPTTASEIALLGQTIWTLFFTLLIASGLAQLALQDVLHAHV